MHETDPRFARYETVVCGGPRRTSQQAESAYGETEEEAIRKVKAAALQILADMIENGEPVPASLNVLFAA